MFRREWRAQVLILTLLTVAVAAATWTAIFAYNAAGSSDGTFGSARHRWVFKTSDPAEAERVLVAARGWFGELDAISSRSIVVPGAAERLEVRAEDPAAPFARPRLGLLEGSYPTAPGEVAVTDGVAELLDVGLGRTTTVGGSASTVVGVVENPADLDDEFALVAPGIQPAGEELTLLVGAVGGGGRESVDAFLSRVHFEGPTMRDSRTNNERAAASLLTFGLASVAMLLVALIASAGFLVIAHRRQRHLGMLAAIGATQRQVRAVTLANGVLVGIVAAIAGIGIGVGVWALSAATVETALGFRIAGINTPVWLLGLSAVLAVATATGAAWWPARTAARVPPTVALSSRPPRPRPVHRSAALALVLLAGGLTALALSDRSNPALIVIGVIVAPLGVLLVAPLAIRAAAVPAARLPVAARLALRDLSRHQARSGAALAAISLGLGVATTVVIIAAAEQPTAASGNLSDRQLLIRIGDAPEPFVVGVRTSAEVADLSVRVEEFADSIGARALIPFDMVVDPARPPEAGLARAGEVQAVEAVRREGPRSWELVGPAYVAHADLLAWLGVDPDAVSDAELLTTEDGPVTVLSAVKLREPQDLRLKLAKIDGSTYRSLPNTLLAEAAVERLGYRVIRSGWLVEAKRPLDAEQRTAARDLARSQGLTVEVRDNQASLATLRAGATTTGVLLALGILAMTVGLIRSEAAGDLRTLTATGATTSMRRALTATTAATLALTGVVLGVAGAYLALIAVFHDDLGYLAHVPVAHLVVAAGGLPLLAAAGGWVLAGRQPGTIARPAIA